MKDSVQEIKDRISIEDLVGQYVQLKKVGRNFKGLCPFHTEKTPSFIVSPERQIAYCFGCNKGGDIFTFIQEVEGVDFNDALKLLAERTGVKLESAADFKPAVSGGQKDDMYRMYEIAAQFYERNLWETHEGEKVLKYIYSRGLTEETVRSFRAGYAPDSFDETYKYLIGKGFSKRMLVSGGLAVTKETTVDKIYDRFRQRLMFPIFDGMGRVSAFGGRALSAEQEPKYMNSPETPIYRKSNILYGFNKSKARIREKGEAVIVEGYFDAIACYQAGVRNVVAPCGTALASSQLRLIRPFAENIILAFDMDAAGQEAANRAFEISQEFAFNVRVAMMPEGKDPAEYAREHGTELLSVIEKAEAYSDYLYRKIINAYGTDTMAARKRIIKDFMPHLQQLKSNIEKDEYVRKLAADLNLKEVQIYDEMKNFRLPDYHPAKAGLNAARGGVLASKARSAEETLLGLMMQFPRVGRLFVKKISDDFFPDDLKAIYKAFLDHYNSDSPTSDKSFVNGLAHDVKENAALITLYVEEKYGEISEDASEKEMAVLVGHVLKNRIDTRRRELKGRLIAAEKEGNRKLCEELLMELNKLYENSAV